MISGTGVQNKIIFKTFAYALPNSQLVGTNSPVGVIKIYYLNNLNKDDTNYAVGVLGNPGPTYALSWGFLI